MPPAEKDGGRQQREEDHHSQSKAITHMDEEHPSSPDSDPGQELGGESEEEPAVDPRLEWMKGRVQSALASVDDDQLRHFFNDEDAMYPCREFLDHEGSRIVFVYPGQDGKFTAAAGAPKVMKGKGLYFTKTSTCKVRLEAIQNQVLVHDLDGNKPLEQLLLIAQEIYFPLMSNFKNHEAWPEVIAKEVTDNMNRFLANTHITAGRVAGNTVLPLPPTALSKMNADRNSMHILENAVVTWTRQVKSILKMEPEQMLREKNINPGPSQEVLFWENKAHNLNSIHEQLKSENVRRVLEVLEAAKSTYFPAFDRLCKDIAAAREEANDTLVYLRPAERFYRLILTESFPCLNRHFRPIMHVTLLVWKTSRFYNTPVRLVVLIRELCNDVIRQACKYMEDGNHQNSDDDGIRPKVSTRMLTRVSALTTCTKILYLRTDMDRNNPSFCKQANAWMTSHPRTSVVKLQKIIDQSVEFKEVYHLYRNKSKSACPEIPWNFQDSVLFGRLDGFLERCHDVLDLMRTLTQFETLKQVEIGGTKGKTLTSSVYQIYFDFTQCMKAFQEAQYDVMNVEIKLFDQHFSTFRTEVNELERRLASVVIQAFDDSTTILGSLKLLDSCETLLEREILHTELEVKQSDLLKDYLQDMQQVQELFKSAEKDPSVCNNEPPHAGAIAWARGLLKRVEDPMVRLRHMSKIVLESEQGRDAQRLFAAITKTIKEYEQYHSEKWSKNVANVSEAKLKMPLLRKSSQPAGLPLLQVNFDPDLVCLLREVKCFLKLGVKVPDAATALFNNEEFFRVQIGNLSLIVNLYNQVLQNLLPVERPLVQQKLDNIDKTLQRGLVHMNWKSHNITDFISQCTISVKEVHTVVELMKENVRTTQSILHSWSEQLLLQRKLSRTYKPDELIAMQEELMEKRYAEITHGSEQIHSCLLTSQKTLHANKGSSHFKAYIAHVNKIVIDGLANAVLANCKYLLLQVDDEYLSKNDINPLLEVRLKLEGGKVVFSPGLGRTSTGEEIGDIIFKWITSFCNIGVLVQRLDTTVPEGNYLADIQESRKVKHMISMISSLVNKNFRACEEYRQSFESYSYVWSDDAQQRFEDFLVQETSSGDSMPSVYAFEEHIHSLKVLENEIRELPTTKVVGWLKFDVKPLRDAMLSHVTQWKEKFEQFPLNYVLNAVSDLDAFIRKSEDGISIDVIDTKSLTIVLTHLLEIRNREREIDERFHFLQSFVHMLLKQEVLMPKEANIQSTQALSRELKSVQEAWLALKQSATMMKDRHAAITFKEGLLLKERGQQFREFVTEFREHFLQEMPFQYTEDVDKAYFTIDLLHHGPPPGHEKMEYGSLVDIVAEKHDLNRLQECFEIDIDDYEIVEECRKECALLKMVWDAVSLVRQKYENWKRIRWSEANLNDLQEQNVQLLEYLHELDPAVQNWNCFTDLMQAIVDMQKTLPMMVALDEPFVQRRHWLLLMNATGKKFETDERFCIGDLLGLRLHMFQEDILEIVDCAQNEQMLDEQLAELDKVWIDFHLQLEDYYDEPMTKVIHVDEVLLDHLKQHIVQLQIMFHSKYVQGKNTHHREKILVWQEQLSNVDLVLAVWTEVQEKWCHLNSIYLASEDISRQLPAQTKSFNDLNLDFLSLMKEASSDPNVIRLCNTVGQQQRLEVMLDGLEACEDALADYLESKRVHFPRLYFLSDKDLLDLISKGKYPRMVMKHLSSCFDNVVALKFEDGNQGESNTALGVFSREEEYLDFTVSFACSGAAEIWLRLLAEHIQKAIEMKICSSSSEFLNMARKDFIFSDCAQIVCIVCKINFCQQVLEVFDDIERGNHNALHELLNNLKASLESFVEIAATDLNQCNRILLTTVMTSVMQQRDIIARFIDDRIESSSSFAWSSQMRYNIDSGTLTVQICDFEQKYGHEYIGNCGCLVSTALSERANICLTQAVRLYLGGSLTGPSGTGKTETTKDLSRSFGLVYYIFNCSDQITQANLGHIFKGLAQLGAWACLDQFNRIELAVISVASSHFKAVLDAQRHQKKEFVLHGCSVKLNPNASCTVFITMHQDYDHTVNVPASLRALFRPCAMVQPETVHIIEVLLTSQGFSRAGLLARKCVKLYQFCESLLSKQHFYDWKLRGIKSAIEIAGEHRRRRMDLEEEVVFPSVLRDFNLSRLACSDLHIFLELIKDLFPGLDQDSMRYHESAFQEKLIQACKNRTLDHSPGFVLKAEQLRDIVSVRSSAYLLGPPRCGKSAMLSVMCEAQNAAGEHTFSVCMNPKAVSRNELFGHIQDGAKWKDGIFTNEFRKFATNRKGHDHQFLILDGDIDSEWIESLNTVMDENKILTLASGERIPLTPSMRLVFETTSMQNASPGSVSRGGVVCMDESQVPWTSYSKRWMTRRMNENEKLIFNKGFEKYVPKCLEFVGRLSSTIVPVRDIDLVASLCNILEATIGDGVEMQLILKYHGQFEYSKALESLFEYATVWGIGGCLSDLKGSRYIEAFDKFWRETFESMFPKVGTVFEYFFDQSLERRKFVNWTDLSSSTSYKHVSETPFWNIYVSSPETCQLSHVLDLLLKQKIAVMLVGAAGTGKTVMVKDRLRAIAQIRQEDSTTFLEINFNHQTGSRRLQSAMEVGLEKKTGNVLGPRKSSRLIYFIDDINMGQTDTYGTSQSVAFLLQHFAYGFWFDRDKLIINEVSDVQYVACMNPSVGSYMVDPRFQAGFTTLTVRIPGDQTLHNIYSSIVRGYLPWLDYVSTSNTKLDLQEQEIPGQSKPSLSDRLILATTNIYKAVAETFTAAPTKPQYFFNLRDVSAVVQGLCRAHRSYYTNSSAIIRLWLHECERVFCDRMISTTDIEVFQKILTDLSMKWWDDYGDMGQILAKPLLFTTFFSVSSDGQDQPYCGVSDFEKMTRTLEEKLAEYNETHAQMRLILFDQAVLNACKIARIIDQPSGNALLVGIGGSGKQSLARLSAFICGCDIHENVVTAAFDIAAFKYQFKETQKRAGMDNASIVQIITEQQITDEHMLALVNDFLSSGNVSDLYTIQERMEICDALRPRLQAEGKMTSSDTCWDFYLESIRKNFHLCICFSPSNKKCHERCRHFPSLIKSTSFIYFHPWQHDALVTVSNRALTGFQLPDGTPEDGKEAMALHMAFVQSTVNTTSEEFLAEEGRHYYATPKGFLDYTELVKTLLNSKQQDLNLKRKRLQGGLSKLQHAAEEVSGLKAKLVDDMALVAEKTSAAESIMNSVEIEARNADNERSWSRADEEQCAAIQAECLRLKHECDKDYETCEPILLEAQRSLETLDKKNLTELKALTSPPSGVEDVLIGVMVLTAKGNIPKELSWNSAKKVMSNVDSFLKMLVNLDKQAISEAAVNYCETKLLSKDSFNPDRIRSKSSAASGMCSWIINICRFHKAFKTILPKKQLMEDAQCRLDEANNLLSDVRSKLKGFDEHIKQLKSEYQAANKEKNSAEAIARKTNTRLDLADRLMTSLHEEKRRWVDELRSISMDQSVLLGNVLLTAAFVSFIGIFNSKYRRKLLNVHWIPDVQERQIHVLGSFHPLHQLADESTIAKWTKEGLPVDPIAQENAGIINTTQRWCLIVDPQIQAITWLKSHSRTTSLPAPTVSSEPSVSDSQLDASSPKPNEEPDASPKRALANGLNADVKEVVALRMNQDNFLQHLELAMAAGEVVLIENLVEDIDPTIELILQRAIVKSNHGKQAMIQLGQRTVEYSPNFVLFLHTKIANPHFKPEIVAQATIVNFSVTSEGLHEQLLSLVVESERPDLFEERSDLLNMQNSMRVNLQDLENNLLEMLSSSEGDLLSKSDLVAGLEETKLAATKIEEEQKAAAVAQRDISTALDVYRPIVERGVLLCSLTDSLWKLDNMYHFSLSQCIKYFRTGLYLLPDEDADEEEEKRFKYMQQRRRHDRVDGKGDDTDTESLALKDRIEDLRASTCLSLFLGVSRALFPLHKIIAAAELCFRIMIAAGSLDPRLLEALVQEMPVGDTNSPLKEWLDAKQWQAVVSLSGLQIQGVFDSEGNPMTLMPFENLDADMHECSRRFRDWVELERPEEVPLPGNWRRIPEFHKLLIVRALRPDRLLPAISAFVKHEMGYKFLIARRNTLSSLFPDTEPHVPILFILTPGVDPSKDVEALATQHKLSHDNKGFAMVCLGQGQEAVAESTMKSMTENGGWVFLQNLHLMKDWTRYHLSDRVEELERAHTDFRLFLSSEPCLMPVFLVKISIKLTNEAPEGIQANIIQAMKHFQEDFFDASDSPSDLKAIVFGLCVAHAVLVQRKKFGEVGWNQRYPFNYGDLRACADISKEQIQFSEHLVPWQDLRFLFGDVIYGGHITDSFDRNIVFTYLELYVCDEVHQQSGFDIVPGMNSPTSWDEPYSSLVAHAQRQKVEEVPESIGLHSNVEMGIMLYQERELCRCVRKLHADESQQSRSTFVQERAGSTINEVVEKLPHAIPSPDTSLANSNESSPYVRLLQQEVTAFNELVRVIRLTISEIRHGLLGERQISSQMECTMNALAENKVPKTWILASYPSLRALGAWLGDLGDRGRCLRRWCTEPNLSLPKVTWLPGLFCPTAFLSAVLQSIASRNGWPLDNCELRTEVTKKMPDEIGAPARDGAYIYGLLLEGASWDLQTSSLENGKFKELICEMPVILVKAVLGPDQEGLDDSFYQCPLYKTRQRGATYAWQIGLRSKVPTSRWVMAGVALTMES